MTNVVRVVQWFLCAWSHKFRKVVLALFLAWSHVTNVVGFGLVDPKETDLHASMHFLMGISLWDPKCMLGIRPPGVLPSCVAPFFISKHWGIGEL